MKLITTALLASSLILGLASASTEGFEPIELPKGFEFTEAQKRQQSARAPIPFYYCFNYYNMMPEIFPAASLERPVVKKFKKLIEAGLALTTPGSDSELEALLWQLEVFRNELMPQLEEAYNKKYTELLDIMRNAYITYPAYVKTGAIKPCDNYNQKLEMVSVVLCKNPKDVSVAEFAEAYRGALELMLQRAEAEQNLAWLMCLTLALNQTLSEMIENCQPNPIAA
jgi:hypothetical protein